MKKYFWPLLFLVASIPSFGQQAKYVKDQLFFKVKDDFQKDIPLFTEKDKDKSQKSIFDEESIAVLKIFKSNTVIENKKASKLPSPKLQRVYAIKVKDTTKIDNLINQLNKLPFIEYVERIPLYEIFYTPNDINSYQWNITKTKIPQAWDLSKGVSTVVIAIVDDEVRLDHEDLAGNIWVNPKETPNNNIDDDGNGYIDDINGYDVADNDNNPTCPPTATNSEFTHGTHCAGIASAKTDNGRGIVSPGFSTKIMAVKTKSNSDLGASLPYAYDGLEYAIASGAANVISMSWGGYGKSSTYQLLINYAYSQGIVLVAAAGNSNTSTPFYPASYNHVISVGATDINDQRAYFSNYGSTLDIMAPGLNIWSTLAGSTSSYGYLSGTSMACPLVAGICGLMLSYAPGSSPDFIQSCLKSSADNIDALNSGYIGQMGAGRVNALGALACLKGIPLAEFTATTTSICSGQSVNFYDKSYGSGINAWNWTFTGANISPSTAKNPIVTYSTPGTYPVSLKVTNNAGSNSITKLSYITVYQPTAFISGSASITSGQSTPLQFDFTGNNPYKVSFSDGTTITSLSGINYSPYYVYVSPTISKTYTISSFSDGSCVGSKSGSALISVSTVTAPCQNCSSISGLVAYYPFCGNANDMSGNNYTGTVLGATLTTDRFGNANSAYNFNGINSKINLGQIQALKLTNGQEVSISAWINYTAYVGPQMITSYGDLGYSLYLQYIGGNFPEWSKQTIANTGTNIPLSSQTWHHIVAVNKIGQSVSMYVDGVLSFSVPFTNTYSYNNDFLIGLDQRGNYAFKGTIDDIKIYNKALSNTEVQSLYNETAPCTTSGLVASYPFCGNANDVSGNNLNGTVTGASLTSDRFGNSNSAYSFNGTNNFIEVQDASLLRPSVISISLWAKISQNALYQLIYKGKWQDASSEAYSINYSQGSTKDYPTFAIKSGSSCIGGNGWKIASNNSNLIDLNKWHHVVATYDGTTQRIYLDNVQVATNSFIGTIDNCIGSTLNFGRSWSTYPYYFKGELDDIKIYNKALSNSEIQALYNEPAPCPTNTISSNCSKALDFIQPNSGPHVSLGNGFNVPNTFSIQSWVKLHSTTSTGFYYVLSKHVSSTYLGSYALFINNKVPTIYITGVGNIASTANGTISLDNNWHHLAGTYDGSVLKLYIDGVLNNSTNFVKNINQTSTVGVHLGASDYGNGAYPPTFDGIMDDAAIFTKTLTQTEIQSYMNGGIPSTTSGLLGYWKFEENDPLICYNSVLGGVNGTIAGNAIRTYDTPFGQAGINCGLVASYPFCGNANDVSGNNYNGTVSGATLAVDRFGNPSSAYYFDGNNGTYINTGFNGILGNNSRSVSAWVKLGSTKEMYAFGWGSRNTPYGSCYNGGFSFNSPLAITTEGNDVVKGFGNTDLNNWHHIVWIAESNISFNQTKIYYDGVLLTTSSVNYNTARQLNTIQDVTLKMGANALVGSGYNFQGFLDDVKIYNKVLSLSEVIALFNEPAPCTTTGLVASYPFCGNANDVSGNKYNGTATGANLTIDRFGNPNSAYLFNGLNSIIKVNSFPVFFLNNFSLSIWLKNTGDAGGQTYDSFLAYGSTQANHSLTYSYDRANTNFSYYDKPNGSYFFNNSANSPKDAWAHIAIVYKNGIAYNYVNGILKDQKVISNAILDGDNLLSIGAFIPDNQYFTGAIDDIKIYNKDLTSGEILALYNEPAPCITCTVTVSPAISGNQTICTNGIENYSITTISGINYTWSVTGGNLLKQNGNLASVTWTGQGIFTLSGIPSSTCVGISKLTVTVGCCTITPVKADFIVNTNSCTGQSFSVTNTSINTTLVSTYLWNFGTDAVPSQSTLPNPSFIYYKNAGQKVITLKVIGSGCKQSDTKTDTLFFFPIPIANAGPDIYLCTTLGQSIGTLPISDNQHVWHPGKYLADSTKSQTTITGFYNGGLVLEVRYGESNCVGYDTVQVYQYPTVTPDKQAICRGEIVKLNTSFWNNSGIYTWSPTSYIYSNFGNYILVKPDRDTTFNLSINSISGCGIASAKIRVEQKYTLEANYSPRKYCANDSVTLQVTNPRANFDYTWLKYSDSTIFKNGVSVKFAYNRTGIQSKVIESSLCKNTLIVPIQVLDSTFVNTYTPVVETLCVEPTLTISSSMAQNKYLWSTGETSNSTKATLSGLYWVKTYNFCVEHVDSFYVTIKTVDNYFPNVFTPNEDQKNDVLIFEGCAFHTEDVSLEIFDRWGGKVYNNSAYKQDWSAKGVPSGMYYYVLKSSKSGELGKGWLQIIK